MGLTLHGDLNAILETGRNFGLELDEELRLVNFGDRDGWWWTDGLVVMRRWTGQRTPRPRLAPVVGYAARPATTVSTHGGVASGGDRIYWVAAETIGRGGIAAETPSRLIQAVVYAGGSWVGPLPNAPVGVTLRQTEGRKVVVGWHYNPLDEQAAPERFDLFSNGGHGAVDLSVVVASVDYEPGRRAYRWASGARRAGDEVAYVVRARSAAGVYSLIAEHADAYVGPHGEYTSIEPEKVPHLLIVDRVLAAPRAPLVA